MRKNKGKWALSDMNHRKIEKFPQKNSSEIASDTLISLQNINNLGGNIISSKIYLPSISHGIGCKSISIQPNQANFSAKSTKSSNTYDPNKEWRRWKIAHIFARKIRSYLGNTFFCLNTHKMGKIFCVYIVYITPISICDWNDRLGPDRCPEQRMELWLAYIAS